MKMPQRSSKSLRDFTRGEAHSSARFLWAADATVALGDLARSSSLDRAATELAGRSVLLALPDQLTTALAMIELDGIARRLALCPPDLPPEQLFQVIAIAQADAVVCGRSGPPPAAGDIALRVGCGPAITPGAAPTAGRRRTEWIMLTSGTTGAVKVDRDRREPIVWGTFYDIRRYGGLQIFLRAMLGGTSLVLSSTGEPMAAYLERLGKRGVTHLTGTPSHWRWALLSPSACAVSPRYVRLSGEIADQAILDNLREAYPAAAIGHAYASTEAGVGFEVNDGREGFPANMIGEAAGDVTMKVLDGSLRIRSPRTARRYLGEAVLLDADGFVDTGDI